MGASHALGRAGERVAERHLIDRGWEILDRNWRAGHAELDLVARLGGVLAFVEVKTCSHGGAGHPLEWITPRKRREVRRAAARWLQNRGASCASVEEVRFDAIAVELCPGRLPTLQHLEDAWRMWKI